VEEILEVFENNHIDPPWSHALVLSLDLMMIWAVAWCVYKVWQTNRAAEQARRMEKSTVSLFEGARFVAGNVELAQGEKTAVRVTIKQEGEEKLNKGAYSHSWTEVERKIEAVPFYLRTTNGERVRVEPPTDVMLVDKLDQMEWSHPTKRRRRAELVAGEQAIIEGRLERGHDPELQNGSGYRDTGARGWVMKPTQRRGMSISSEGLARRHELRAKAFVRLTFVTIIISVIATAMTIPYRLRTFAGKNVEATYLHRGVYLEKDKKNQRTTKTYTAHAKYIDDNGIEHVGRYDVDFSDYEVLPPRPGRIWMRVVPAYPQLSALGKGTSVSFGELFFRFFILVIGRFCIDYTRDHRRWYEGHVVDRGKGQLPAPSDARFLEDLQPETKSTDWRGPVAEIPPISTDFTK